MRQKKLTWATANWAQKTVSIGIPLCFFCFSGISFSRGLRSLESLDVAQGVVNSSKVVRIDGRTRPFAAIFSLQNNNTPFGIQKGQNQTEAELLATKIPPQSIITVYYDASGAKDNGINLHVYQVSKGSQIIYSIAERRSEELFMASAFLLLGIVFSFWIASSLRTPSPNSRN